jgi:hypothetical protein
MALDPRQRRTLERFFPGLVTELENLGPGEFAPELPKPRAASHLSLIGIWVPVTYMLSDRHYVQVHIDLQIKQGHSAYVPPPQVVPVDLSNWERIYYRLHYGAFQGETAFRFDLSAKRGHHVHLCTHPKDKHISWAEVKPDVRNLDPRAFVKMVAAFRAHNNFPVQKK